jgi:acetyl-CoA carboxylase biotin carboxyl carrier protein
VAAVAAASAAIGAPASREIASQAVAAPASPGAKKATGIATANGGRGGEPPAVAANQKLIASPMVGTFYRASSPDSNPFVEEGDSVRKGQTLCIIEAMKMMNEIDADAGGRVVRILCDNGQPIEYGQPLMILELG